MKRLILPLLLPLLFAFVDVNDVNLKYHFKVGDQYELKQNTTQKIKQTLGDFQQNIETNLEFIMQLKVVELKSGGAKIEVNYSKISTRAKTMMGEITMSSESEEDNPYNKFVKSVTGKSFFFDLTSQGKVGNVEGVEILLSDIAFSGLDGQTGSMLKQMMEQSFSKDAIKGNLEMSFIAYPDKVLNPSEMWKSTTVAPMNFPIKIENTWQLGTINGTTAAVSSKGVITTTDNEKTISIPGGIKATADLSGNQELNGSVNMRTGWPSEIKINSDIKGKMILLAGGQIPSDMEIPMEILSESVIAFNKK